MFGIILYDSDKNLHEMRKLSKCRSCYNSWWQREFYLLSVIRYYQNHREKTKLIMREMLGKFANKHGSDKIIDEILDGKWKVPFPTLKIKGLQNMNSESGN